jgi:hypothetical protein
MSALICNLPSRKRFLLPISKADVLGLVAGRRRGGGIEAAGLVARGNLGVQHGLRGGVELDTGLIGGRTAAQVRSLSPGVVARDGDAHDIVALGFRVLRVTHTAGDPKRIGHRIGDLAEGALDVVAGASKLVTLNSVWVTPPTLPRIGVVPLKVPPLLVHR